MWTQEAKTSIRSARTLILTNRNNFPFGNISVGGMWSGRTIPFEIDVFFHLSVGNIFHIKDFSS